MQVEILLFFQKYATDLLDKIFINITNLGSEAFYFVVIAIIFWCINKKTGLKIMFVVLSSTLINTSLKDLVKTQRPFFDKRIEGVYIKSAPGNSFPSGHTQGVTTFWYYLMRLYDKSFIKILGWTIVFLVGLSRLYLRVHWPIDVVGGFFIAIICVRFFEEVMKQFEKKKVNTVFKIMLLLLSNAIVFIYVDANVAKMFGLFTGAVLGYLGQEQYIKFCEKSNIVKQIVKVVIGLVALVAIKYYLKVLLPVGILYDYIRYFIVGINVTFIMPYVFVKTNLCERNK